jgi:proline dehydrogenase
MLRRAFLWLSERRGIFDLVKRNGFARRIASRFVAGETVESAIVVSRALNAAGIRVSLDLLGESVTNAAETRRARDEVRETIDAITDAGVKGGVSVKLTQLGLDIDRTLCLENVRTILRHAREREVFIRIDMESSDYTERTLRMFFDHLQPEFHGRTGVVIQSYLHRSDRDVEKLVERGASVRLCKGAYAEPPSVAFQARREVNASFVRLMERLLLGGHYPAIATHDEALVGHAVDFASRHNLASDQFEFQLLYGVRRDLQNRLQREGFNVRVYIPFGTAWYPYLMRRLAERPANTAFMLRSLVKEAVARGR